MLGELSLRSVGGVCEAEERDEEVRKLATPTHHSARLRGQVVGVQRAAEGAGVKRLQPRGVFLLGVPQARMGVGKIVDKTSRKRRSVLLMFMGARWTLRQPHT